MGETGDGVMVSRTVLLNLSVRGSAASVSFLNSDKSVL